MVTEDEAIQIAKQTAEVQGWPWVGEVLIDREQLAEGHYAWTIKSNAGALGRNVLVTVDAKDGSVLNRRFWPR